MQDFAETLLNTVAAMSAASFGYFGVTLKDDQPRLARPEPAVIRRVAAPPAQRQTLSVRPARVTAEPCPEQSLVKA